MEVDNIELTFGYRRILYGIYLKAETGKITGIIGRNGSGKTCLLRIIFGNLDPKYKNIRIDGTYQKRKLYHSQCVAYLPQHRLLPKNIKLAQAFDFFEASWTEFLTVFESFKKYAPARSKELSFGELRVVETYLVLTSKKEIILLDEPFSFVSPLYVEKFKTIIRAKSETSAIVVTDHFYRDILDLSDTLYVLKNGYSKKINSKKDLEAAGYINLEKRG